MSARSIATANISWGLVSVPVKVYSTGESAANVSFNWIHKDCGSRLKQQYVCAKEGVVVPRDDMVKGYEFAKDQYVLFTPDELKALEATSDGAVSIEEFVPAEQVDRVYSDRFYYLGPDKGGDRAYRLLSRAMRETGLSALGRYAARGQQYLVLLSPMEDGIVMEQLRYADEVRDFSEVPIGDADVKDEELKLAKQLIEQVAAEEFHPEKYSDEVRARVLELIEGKIQGQEITAAPEEEPQAQIIDLMDALKRSLASDEDGERKPAKRSAHAKKGAGGRKKAAGAN
ncbi:MAG TPA: Ku protein [Longimicrobiales bacterium]|nr:Ku protein [Longimicrobiales bacterium]